MKEYEELVPLKELYKDDDYLDYSQVIDSLGFETVIQEDVGSYQGDSYLLLKDNEYYGFLQFGWGSCSGCDWLQSCSNLEEVEELRLHLWNGIKWFDNSKEALDYFENHDWKGDYSWHFDEMKIFIEKCLEYLK